MNVGKWVRCVLNLNIKFVKLCVFQFKATLDSFSHSLLKAPMILKKVNVNVAPHFDISDKSSIRFNFYLNSAKSNIVQRSLTILQSSSNLVPTRSHGSRAQSRLHKDKFRYERPASTSPNTFRMKESLKPEEQSLKECENKSTSRSKTSDARRQIRRNKAHRKLAQP